MFRRMKMELFLRLNKRIMEKFDKYLEELSNHELDKYFNIPPRQKLMALS